MKVRRTQTANRILEASRDLFNRLGEPNVAPAALAGALGMSTGNLYYHYPSKAELVSTLASDYAKNLSTILSAAHDIQSVEDAWFFLHTVFELIDAYRFLYRDLNDLLSKNRQVEIEIQLLMAKKNQAFQSMIRGLIRCDVTQMTSAEVSAVATSMTVLMSYWFSYAYANHPRHALEPENAQQTLLQGAFHVLNLLSPYLQTESRKHFQMLLAAYL